MCEKRPHRLAPGPLAKLTLQLCERNSLAEIFPHSGTLRQNSSRFCGYADTTGRTGGGAAPRTGIELKVEGGRLRVLLSRVGVMSASWAWSRGIEPTDRAEIRLVTIVLGP
jgi:hypothetical protein